MINPLHNQPTPPVTPVNHMPPSYPNMANHAGAGVGGGANMPPGGHHGQQQDIKPNMADLKPNMMKTEGCEELRLTFPVRDGVLMSPFRLEHNLATSTHQFVMKDSVFQTLSMRLVGLRVAGRRGVGRG